MRDSWDRRLGWTRGLVSADPAEREAALRRHLAADAALVRTARRLNSPSRRFRDSEPWARLHATYVLKLLVDPGIPNTRATWTRHLAAGSAAGHGAAVRGCAR
ncbi:hypothetical protein [Streptomyces sp. MS1.AVA.4]|uniref:Uncharacterized protein n=1 Tax=Streptomyces pratisoli TaxID=3139917 RepID=A0ACC6QDX4_9ACTN